jgi:glycerol-3-phosphate acyltransferase PlsX
VSGQVTIALDAMGGDHAPRSVLQGAAIALRRLPEVRYLFYGDEAKVGPVLKRMQRLRKAGELRHTSEAVAADAKPAMALRTGRNSSMRMAIDAVRDAEAAGVVSAGNTGALMAMAKFSLKMLSGIDRPAMATFFPTSRGESAMLDLGANIDCSSENLVQFAIMGEVFARTVLGSMRPSVGLLNVGSEDLKGNEVVRNAAAMIRALDPPINFHGFVEGNDIAAGTVDVVVADGFTGNIALKTAEGTAKLYTEFLRRAFRSSVMARIGYLFARRALMKLRARVDPRRYNGAMFLGLRGIAVKAHGASDALAFATAIGVAVDMARNGFIEQVKAEIEGQFDAGQAAPKAATS